MQNSEPVDRDTYTKKNKTPLGFFIRKTPLKWPSGMRGIEKCESYYAANESILRVRAYTNPSHSDVSLFGMFYEHVVRVSRIVVSYTRTYCVRVNRNFAKGPTLND